MDKAGFFLLLLLILSWEVSVQLVIYIFYRPIDFGIHVLSRLLKKALDVAVLGVLGVVRHRWVCLFLPFLSRSILFLLVFIFLVILLLLSNSTLVVFQSLAFSGVLKDHSIHHLEGPA